VVDFWYRMKVYVSGKLVDKAEAKVSVFDHGLLYGDGIFEGIRLYNKCVFKLDEHLERLEYSAKAILLDLPWSREAIAEAVLETCRANNLTDGYIRLMITRGVGTLGLDPQACSNPELIIIADKIEMYPEKSYKEGLKIITAATRRVGAAALSSHIKSLNYLNSILAKIEASHQGCPEAVMLNEQGYVAECTGDNIFIVSKGELQTPNSADGALKGITREMVKSIADTLGVPLRIVKLTRYDLWNADECFLTGTAAELIAVVEIDGRKVGDGKPGVVTQKCLKIFRERVTKEGRFL